MAKMIWQNQYGRYEGVIYSTIDPEYDVVRVEFDCLRDAQAWFKLAIEEN